jgi:hypothetical protein
VAGFESESGPPLAWRSVGATSPISAASRDVVLPDTEVDGAHAFSIIPALIQTQQRPPLLISFSERFRSMILVSRVKPHRAVIRTRAMGHRQRKKQPSGF